MKQAGLTLDVDTANGQIGQWLHEVAHQRIHGTTKQKPAELLVKETLALAELPALQTSTKAIIPVITGALPIESFQHPLSLYDQLIEVAL